MLLRALFVVLLLGLSLPAFAQEYPVEGEIYLSFEQNRRVTTRDVEPGEQFELWVLIDIPTSTTRPQQGIVGVEGGVALPPQLRLIDTAFLVPAINLGATFREPGLETFVVGLGECQAFRPVRGIGYLLLELVEDGQDIEIGVTAPAVQAAAVSSFAGLGPGWAAQNCVEGGPIDLVLFAETPGAGRSVVLNSSAVSSEVLPFTYLKAGYR